jgi:hypothetical protein
MIPETANWRELLQKPSGGDHFVQIYQDEAFLCEAVAEYTGSGLRRGERRRGHRDAFPSCRVRSAAAGQWRCGRSSRAARPASSARCRRDPRQLHARWHARVADLPSADRRRDRPIAARVPEGARLRGDGRSPVAARRARSGAPSRGVLVRSRRIADVLAALLLLHGQPGSGGLSRTARLHLQGPLATHSRPRLQALQRGCGRGERGGSRPSACADAALALGAASAADCDAARPGTLLWLQHNMPRTAEKVLAQVRSRYSA